MTHTVDVQCPFCHQHHEVDVVINDEPYECGYGLGDGGQCSREVESPNEYCWQHE